ncbi:hypothetical protein [Halorussus sp. MSC15.2]|uniref:hypothetical protein n=1 Tax=Halorussus sp. MSC15.2 TaxID=2283638 RepID=UPI0013D5C96C|nr:hypothetical protein [Halorussus sp. MSC15.2]NEU57311.1 hypothetical protein [Halorussus sp. MSC15.2]
MPEEKGSDDSSEQTLPRRKMLLTTGLLSAGAVGVPGVSAAKDSGSSPKMDEEDFSWSEVDHSKWEAVPQGDTPQSQVYGAEVAQSNDRITTQALPEIVIFSKDIPSYVPYIGGDTLTVKIVPTLSWQAVSLDVVVCLNSSCVSVGGFGIEKKNSDVCVDFKHGSVPLDIGICANASWDGGYDVTLSIDAEVCVKYTNFCVSGSVVDVEI